MIAMQYLSLTFQECMQTLPQKMVRNKIKAYTHTAFLNIFRVVHEKKEKNALDIDCQHFKRSPISAYLWLNTNHLRNFRSDGLSQDISCKQMINQ